VLQADINLCVNSYKQCSALCLQDMTPVLVNCALDTSTNLISRNADFVPNTARRCAAALCPVLVLTINSVSGRLTHCHRLLHAPATASRDYVVAYRVS